MTKSEPRNAPNTPELVEEDEILAAAMMARSPERYALQRARAAQLPHASLSERLLLVRARSEGVALRRRAAN